jgi:hypothetical protein
MTRIKAAVGLSTKKEPVHAALEAVQQAKKSLKIQKIDLAIFFSSIDIAYPSLLKTITLSLGKVPLIGSSSKAIISSHGILKRGLAIILVSFPDDVYFNTACVKEINTRSSQDVGRELAEKLNYGFRDIRRDLSIIFSDGLTHEGSGLIFGLQQKLGSSFPLIVAQLADNLRLEKTYLYFNQDLLNQTTLGVLLGGKLNFGLGIKHGWQPLGKPRWVTRSKGNIVYEIDGITAAKLYEEYFAYDLTQLRENLDRISVFYPLGIYLPGEKEYLLRNILSIQDNGSLIFQGDVPEGSQVRFMIGTKESCLQATHEALSEAKKNIGPHPISFVLLFDSISRYILLGREAHKELEIIKNGLGKDTPILGLYTHGEQAPLTAVNYRGKAYLHNQTITLLAIGG